MADSTSEKQSRALHILIAKAERAIAVLEMHLEKRKSIATAMSAIIKEAYFAGYKHGEATKQNELFG